ncbi:MAG: NTP transferase domain-containing protein [Chloroflexi bacterium]|nr:NTP transferase domain-containing protein [Chloroflexota bacterium]
MKIIIPLAGFGTRMRPHTWSRPKPLLHVAGNTVIGHLLNQMTAVTTEEVVFVVGYKGDEIEAWIRAHYPQLNAHFLVQEEALGQAHAIWLCRDFMDDGELLIAFGDGVVKAAYRDIPEPTLDGVCLVQEVEDPRKFGVVALDEAGMIQQFIEKPQGMAHRQAIAGIYWFRNGRFLRNALDQVIAEDRKTKGEYYLADAYQVMLEQGAKLLTKPTEYWLDAGNPENVLHTNQKLLALGFGTDDAIDRSYAEDFTALPPVFIDETAVIDQSVVGPFASIGAGATIKNSIVRNSIIDAGAYIENCVLDGALVGENGRVIGQPKAMFVGDNSTVEIG